MAGYAARARITHVAPHRVGHHEPVDAAVADFIELDGPAVEEVSGKPYLATLSDIWDDVCEIWRQGMDVLRDPQIY